MAEHPHIALVRKGYDAFSRGDMETLAGIMAADCTHHVPGNHMMSGDYKGRDSVLEYYGNLARETGGTMRVELTNVMVDGRGHAVAMHRFTADRKGEHLDAMGCIVFRIVGDKATDLDECVEDLNEADRFWS